jgi:hypothetical protein
MKFPGPAMTRKNEIKTQEFQVSVKHPIIDK